MNFEWQTEEESAWQEGRPEKEQQPAPARPRRLPFLLAVAALLALVGLFWQQANRRVAEVESHVETEVQASAALAWTAAAQQDREMLRQVLSGRDEEWLQAQYDLLEKGLLFGDAARPFFLEHDGTEPASISLALSPDLEEVELVRTNSYQSDLAGKIVLQQTHFFRKGRERWLLSPPPAGFWGEQEEITSRYLHVHYPARDGRVVRRLVHDLDQLLAELCVSFARSSCANTLEIGLEFGQDGLLNFELEQQRLLPGQPLHLPAPSLVGVPVDEAGYQALYRGYAGVVVAAAVRQLVDYPCCDRYLFYRAALEWQLAQMELRPWSLSLPEYQESAAHLEDTRRWQQLWQQGRTDPPSSGIAQWQVTSLVEYVMAESDLTAANLHRSLAEAASFSAWSEQATSFSSLYYDWRSFLFEKIASAPGPALPAQDLLVTCEDNNDLHLYRYRPGDESWWRSSERLDGYRILRPLADDSGFTLRGQQLETLLWRNGAIHPLGPVDVGVSLVPLGNEDPLSQLITVAQYRRMEPGTTQTLLVDTGCTGSACDWQPVPAPPLWSPDGSQMLVVFEGAIWRGSRQASELQRVGEGKLPFWIDQTTYGYARSGTVVVAGTEDDQPYFEYDGSWPGAPGGHLTGVAAGSNEKGPLLFLVDDKPKRQLHLFLVERSKLAAGEPAFTPLAQLHAPVDGPRVTSFSPDGRWLSIALWGVESARRTELLLFDLETGEQKLATPASGLLISLAYDWSEDGRWLARTDDDLVELIAPADGQSYRLFLQPPLDRPEFSICISAVWIDRFDPERDEL